MERFINQQKVKKAMWTDVTPYTAEIGKFALPYGVPLFGFAHLKLNLTKNTSIGRAASEDEQRHCDGGLTSELTVIVEGGNGKEKRQIRFQERASYNGQKIIIPNDHEYFSGSVSSNQGEIRIGDDGASVFYIHRSPEQFPTYFWSQKKGIIGAAIKPGEITPLLKAEPLYLLFGAENGSNHDELTVLFPRRSYYAKLSLEDPDAILDWTPPQDDEKPASGLEYLVQRLRSFLP